MNASQDLGRSLGRRVGYFLPRSPATVSVEYQVNSVMAHFLNSVCTAVLARIYENEDVGSEHFSRISIVRTNTSAHSFISRQYYMAVIY